MNPDATLSAVVLTRNSSALLERCLQSLKFADELIVIDDFSTMKQLKYQLAVVRRWSNMP